MIFLLVLLSSVWTHGTLACSHSLTDDQGYIAYTDYAVECSWTINPGPGYLISVGFLTTTLMCGQNYIQAVKGSTEISPEICDQEEVVVNATETITIIYWSRPGGPTLTFAHRAEFGYFVSDASAQCGGLVQSTVITPPKHEGGESFGLMLDNIHCRWAIIVPPESFVYLFFTYMNLESRGGACVDKLQIKQVVNGTVEVLGTYCGTFPPESFAPDSRIVLVEVMSDNDNPSGGFIVDFERVRNSYGVYKEVLTSPVGVVEALPRDPSQIRSVKQIWSILGLTGDSLQVFFTRNSLDPVDDCEDRISFARGRDLAEILVRGCDFQVGVVYQIEAHEVYVYYYSARRGRGKGFSFTYLMAGNACGGLFFSPTGVLTFPTPAGTYDDMTMCAWAIVGLPSATVTVDIVTNDMEMTDNCAGDSLEVYDGYKWSSPLLLEVCGNLNGTAVSTGLALHAVFQSDASSSSHQGFTLHWRIEYGECGGAYNETVGTFSSESRGPSGVVHCEWHIVTRFGDIIEVTFSEFDLLNSNACDEDYVEFRNGDSADSPLLLRTCDYDISRSFVSISHELYIIYHSSASSTGNGVSASYSAGEPLCGGTFVADSAMSFSHTAGGSETCVWLIGGAPNSISSLLIESLNLQTSVDCNDEFLEIYDGNSTLILRTCGTELPGVIHSSPWNQLIVIYRSFGASTSVFSAVYLISGPGCGSMELSDHGTIQSPQDEEGRYPLSIRCYWIILAQTGQKVVLYEKYNGLFGLGFCKDVLEVHHGTEDTNDNVDYCRINLNKEPIISEGNSLFLQFRSGKNADHNSLGFLYKYEILDYPFEKEILTSTESTISASRDGSTDNIHRQWQIVGPSGATFSIYFTKFFLDTTDNCNVDYFEIRNGFSADSPLVARSCYFDVGTVYEFDIDDVFIIFHSENTSRGDGFSLGYSMVIEENCGGLVTMKDGDFSYPFAGQSYDNYERCYWLFLGLEGEKVEIQFRSSDIDYCHNDNLTIYDGPTDQDNVLGEICGGDRGDVVSTTNVLRAAFITNHESVYEGFDAVYTISYDGCGGTFTELSGNFSSPPTSPATELECHWVIMGRFDSVIQLNFTEFDLMGDCNVDYVKIRGSDGLGSQPLYSLCHTDTVMSYNVSGILHLSYHLGDSSSANGISASYRIINPEIPTTTTTTTSTTTTATTTEESSESDTSASKQNGYGPNNHLFNRQKVNQKVQILFKH